MPVFSFLITVAGFAVAVVASRWVVDHASRLAYGSSIPPYLIGITILALGTDGPEIANSVMASLAGHGDLNVGDSVGSVFTQITLVLGIMPFAAHGFPVGPARSAIVAALAIVGLLFGALFCADGFLSRPEGLFLVGTWFAATFVCWRFLPPPSEPLLNEPSRSRLGHLLLLLLSLGLVMAGAGAAVQGLVQVSAQLGVPEYAISFFGSSVGTSLPEMVVAITALRRGERDLAMGDVMGACLLDATVSVGVGPAVAPTAITAAMAVRGALLATGALVIASLLLWSRGRNDRWSGTVLLAVYAAAYFLLL